MRCHADPLKRPLSAVMSCEIGGGNGLEPLAIGARMGLPIVDADFMGRAFPELQVQLCHSSLCMLTTTSPLSFHARRTFSSDDKCLNRRIITPLSTLTLF
jgi:DUF917 family protein